MSSGLSIGSVIPLGFTAPRSGQVTKSFTYAEYGDGTYHVIGTGTVGKTFYCAGVAAATQNGDTFSIRKGGVDVVVQCGVTVYSPTIISGTGILFTLDGGEDLEVTYPVGKLLQLTCWGWEQ